MPPDLSHVYRPQETVTSLAEADEVRYRMSDLWQAYERYRHDRDAHATQLLIDHLGQTGAVLSAIVEASVRVGDTQTAELIRPRLAEIHESLRLLFDQRDQASSDPDGLVVVEESVHFALNFDFGETVGGGVHADDRSALTGSDHPPPVEDSRRYYQPGGHRPPLLFDQELLERLVPRDASGRPVRFPDVRLDWFTRVNDSGPELDPTRGINCVDCIAAFLDTWFHGRPRVSAPRTFDSYVDGHAELPQHGELGGMDRLRDVVGTGFVSYPLDLAGRDPQMTYQTRMGWVEADLRQAGPGSVAVIAHRQQDGASHVWLAVNQDGEILYLDPQHRRVADRPLYQDVHGSRGIVELQVAAVDAQGQPLHPAAAPATWLGDDPQGQPEGPGRPTSWTSWTTASHHHHDGCPGDGPPFPNRLGGLDGELAEADAVGLTPVRPGEPGFEEAINAGTVKWAILEDGTLLVIPKMIYGDEMSHTVIARGSPIWAAGEAEIAAIGELRFGVSISNHSGHYVPCDCSLDYALTVFAGHGIVFDPRDVTYVNDQ